MSEKAIDIGGLDQATLELDADEALGCWPLRFRPPPRRKGTDAGASTRRHNQVNEQRK